MFAICLFLVVFALFVQLSAAAQCVCACNGLLQVDSVCQKKKKKKKKKEGFFLCFVWRRRLNRGDLYAFFL